MSAKERKLLFMPYDGITDAFYDAAAGFDKLCLVVWALEYCEKYVRLFEEYSDDQRVRQAREAAFLWAKGAIRMPEARRYILAAHRAAAESCNAVAEAAARAVAHAASSVHSGRHAAGLTLYGLTALGRKYGRDSAEVKEELNGLTEGLLKLSASREFERESWARFLVSRK